MKSKRIILTGGGTAGHVWPLIVIAEELRRLIPAKFLYIGSNGIEKNLAKKFYAYHTISTGKWRRYISLTNIFDMIRVMHGTFQAWREIKRFKPDLIIAKGGYVTLPVLIAARFSRIQVVIHETDITMGAVNHYASSFARFVFTGFPAEHYPDMIKQKIVYSGTPVRAEFFKTYTFGKNLAKNPSEPTMPICLIIGGSQGARAINSLILQGLPELLKKVTIVHLTGSTDYIRCINVKSKLPKELFGRYQPIEFTPNNVPRLMTQATVIVSRAGGTTLAEIAAEGKPAIIIPLPSAAANHQVENARWYAEKKAVITLDEPSLTAKKLISEIMKVIADKKLQSSLSMNIRQVAPVHSIATIIKHILQLLS